MTSALYFEIPGIPVFDSRVRFSRSGFAYKKTATRDYQSIVRLQAAKAVHEYSWTCDKGIFYGIYAKIYRPNNLGDFDNVIKNITDPMNKLVYPDDRFITHAIIEMDVDNINPRVEVWVTKLEKIPTKIKVKSRKRKVSNA